LATPSSTRNGPQLLPVLIRAPEWNLSCPYCARTRAENIPRGQRRSMPSGLRLMLVMTTPSMVPSLPMVFPATRTLISNQNGNYANQLRLTEQRQLPRLRRRQYMYQMSQSQQWWKMLVATVTVAVTAVKAGTLDNPPRTLRNESPSPVTTTTMVHSLKNGDSSARDGAFVSLQDETIWLTGLDFRRLARRLVEECSTKLPVNHVTTTTLEPVTASMPRVC
jgi:hypothetical protein